MTEGVRLASRMGRIRPFYVMDLLARARRLEAAGRSIIHLEVGEPDFPTPAPIVEAGRRALAEGRHHYTPASGLPELRQAIAGLYRGRFGLTIDPQRILITPGASGALQLVTGVLVGAGERVLMADPGYPCNRHFVALAEGEPVGLPVGAETGYQLTAETAVAAWTPNTRAALVASPSNPTGTLIERPALAALHQAVRRRGGDLIVDEIYQGLVYEGEEHSALELGEEVFVINSFSKFFGMTGWRLGWVVAPPAYVEPLDRLAQNIFLAAPTPAQYAALAAFSIETATILEQRRQEFQRRRDFLLPALEALGFRFPVKPRGAFYLYADCSALTDDSFRLADELLNKAGVAVTPGLDFGHHQPERHLRFAYTTGMGQLAEGVKRIRRFLGG
jgi:aspartate/methionine/tyrosine aminotransferase